MRVNTDEIKEGGLDRAWDVSREELDEMVSGEGASYRAAGPVRVDARLRKVERRVLLNARAKPVLNAPCGRCLTPVKLEVPLAFDLTFVPEDLYREPGEGAGDDSGQGETASSFEPRAENEETFAGKEIDLDPVVREQLILALPHYPVCNEDCKGLCPVCGNNLNERECACDRKVPDPRWAGLEKFRNK